MREAPALFVDDWGLLDYATAYARQKALVDRLRREPSALDTLVFVEHPDVYTYGRKSEPGFRAQPSYEIERGGEATFHNPGQLVAYPIVRLHEGERDVRRYLRAIEAALGETLRHYGLASSVREGATGLWVCDGMRKIASIGVAVSSWITYHGLALNIENDLRGFSRISPCGFSARVMTSLKAELGASAPRVSDVKLLLARSIAKHLGRSLFLRRAGRLGTVEATYDKEAS